MLLGVMDARSLPEDYIAFEIGLIDQDGFFVDIEAYASGQPESGDELLEVLWLDRKRGDEMERARLLLREFIRKTCLDYQLDGPVAKRFARGCCERRLRQYLAGECTPWDVRRMVRRIEELFDFPSWLGKIRDLCDGIETGTPATDCRHLEVGIREFLADA